MKIMVTGANGYVGFRIANHLQKLGYDVLGIIHHDIDRQYPFPTAQMDLSQTINLSGSFDAIVHAAGRHPGGSISVMKRDNVDVMNNVIRFAKHSHVKKMIYLSTISVYGEIRECSVDERTDVINPSPYGLTKYMAELLLHECCDFTGIVLRLPGIIGCGATKSWLPSVYKKLIAGNQVRIFNPDFQMNNFVYINDLIDFIQHLLKENFLSNEIFVLGSKNMISIRDCVTTIKKQVKSTSSIVVEPSNQLGFSLNINRASKAGYTSRNIQYILAQSFPPPLINSIYRSRKNVCENHLHIATEIGICA